VFHAEDGQQSDCVMMGSYGQEIFEFIEDSLENISFFTKDIFCFQVK
jgi:hypothetical protein